MRQEFYLFFLSATLSILNVNGILAQKPVKPSAPTSTAKKLSAKTFLGKATGTISLNAEEAGLLVSQRLQVLDDKNAEYLISSYQFAYKRIGVTEDEETGKTSLQSDVAAQRFTTTPLPAVWQKNITDGLHKGEELYFFDIIVIDKQGRRFFAPEIKISIL
jgi:hypothetical protein